MFLWRARKVGKRLGTQQRVRLQKLSGCSGQVIQRLAAHGRRLKAGRPCQYALEVEIQVLLVKLRLNLPYRVIEAITGIDAVAASRMVRRLLVELVDVPLQQGQAPVQFLVVGSTVSRVGVSGRSWHSGYKHHRGIKTQVLCDDRKRIHHLSEGVPASVHDKRLWNRTVASILPILHWPVLADNAYAGGDLENEWLFRPSQWHERAYRMDREGARAANRALSQLRVRVEHVIASLKRFRILCDRFPLALNLYTPCLHAIVLIHNLGLELK